MNWITFNRQASLRIHGGLIWGAHKSIDAHVSSLRLWPTVNTAKLGSKFRVWNQNFRSEIKIQPSLDPSLTKLGSKFWVWNPRTQRADYTLRDISEDEQFLFSYVWALHTVILHVTLCVDWLCRALGFIRVILMFCVCRQSSGKAGGRTGRWVWSNWSIPFLVLS